MHTKCNLRKQNWVGLPSQNIAGAVELYFLALSNKAGMLMHLNLKGESSFIVST